MRNPHLLRIAAGMLAITTLLTTACKDENVVAPETKVYAKAQFVHVAPKAPGLFVSVDGKNINKDSMNYLQILRTTDSSYLDVDVTAAGKRVIKLDSKTGNVVTDSFALNKDVYYSIFTYTDVDTTKTRNLLASDNLAAPTTGKVKLRVAHFISDANFECDIEAVTPLVGTPSLRNDFSALKFKSVTDFIEVAAGTYDFKVKLKGTTNVLLTVPSVKLDPDKIYTMVARGFLYKAEASGVFMVNTKK